MVYNGGRQNAGNDREGLLEPRGQDEREKLGLVADFSEGDDTGRDEERFHESSEAGSMTIDHDASPAKSEALWSKVLPGVEAAYAMTCGSSVLT